MTRSTSVRSLLLPATALLLQAHTAAATVRPTYEIGNLNRETLEVDLVEACKGQSNCQVQASRDGAVHVTAAGTTSFNGLNASDGIIADKGENGTTLPANPCIDVSPYVIDSFAWKASAGHHDRAIGGFDGGTMTFTKTVDFSGEWGVYSFSDGIMATKPSHFCINPAATEKVAFSVLWVKMHADLQEPKGNISFSTNMKRASMPLLGGIQRAIGEALTLADPDLLYEVVGADDEPTDAQKAEVESVIKKVRLLISTLQAAEETLSPEANESKEMLSVTHPRVIQAMASINDAWNFIEPLLSGLTRKEQSLRKVKQNAAVLDIFVAKNSFQRNLTWLQNDINSFKIYPDAAQASSTTVSFAEMLKYQLGKMRASLTDPAQTAGGLPAAIQASLDDLQSRLVQLEQAAQKSGEAAPETMKAAADFATAWNSDTGQKLVAQGQKSAPREMRLFIHILEGLRGLPCATDLEIKLAAK